MYLSQFGLKPLSLSDKTFIDNVLNTVDSSLSSYTFNIHYIWRDIFQFYWGIIDDYFCLFAVYNDYIYMPITPINTQPEVFSGEHYAQIISRLFSIMHHINNNPAASRIENIDKAMKEDFLSMGYNLIAGDYEYVYLREDLVNLKGNPFKSKRGAYNYFSKNYIHSFKEFQPGHIEECMILFEQWKKNRGKKTAGNLYQALLEDTKYSHKQVITNYDTLSLTGRIVQIDGRIEGYTFGFGKGDVFYILIEITNPEIKGLSQFIFREFCRDLSDYTFINTLGDSDLPNLRNTKLSYRPCKVVPACIAYSKPLIPSPFKEEGMCMDD